MHHPRSVGPFGPSQGSRTAASGLTILLHIEMKSIGGEAWQQDFAGPSTPDQEE